jgi:hypothetical protein
VASSAARSPRAAGRTCDGRMWGSR